jgi:ABC-type branched-subunit amino acid transport system substrate-binding protein
MSSYYSGIEAYFSYVNENGGVYGKKLNFIRKDDSGLPARAVSSNSDLVLRDNVLALISTAQSCPTQVAVSSNLNLGARGIPNLFVDCQIERNSEDPEPSSPSRTSSTYYNKVGGQSQIAILKSFADKNFPNQKIALVYQNDAYASAITKIASDPKLHCSGKFVAGTASTAVNIVVETCKNNGGLKDGDLVFYSGAASGFGVLTAQFQKNNLNLKYFVNDDAVNPSVFSAMALSSNSLPEIYSVSHTHLISETSNPAVAILQAIGQKYRGNSTVDQRFLNGMNVGYILSNLVATVGPGPTRERLMKAMDLYGAQFDVLGLSERSQNPVTKFAPLGGVVVKHVGTSLEAVSEVMSVENGAISLKPRKQIAISAQALPTLVQKLPNSAPQPKPTPTPTPDKATPDKATPKTSSPDPVTELDGEEEAPFGKISVKKEKNKYLISISSNLPNESLQVRATRKGQKSISFKVETDDDGIANFSTSRSLNGFQVALLLNGERLSSVRAN